MQPILCKDSARQEQNEINTFISYAEPQLILCKDNARREQNEINKFISYAEPQLILCKDNPITFKHKIKGSETYLFSLNPTKILYARTTTESLQVQTTDLGLNHIHEIFPHGVGNSTP